MTITSLIALTRLDKPIGIWLLFFPAGWAVALAGGNGDLMLLMLVGAALTRAAGCIINDITDRKLDAQVERTRQRPLASGAIRLPAALALLALLLAAAAALALSLPRPVLMLALLAVPMIAAYPWMKRITGWPQAFLGLTFNLGALMGWVATGQPLAAPAFTLYAACICWTLAYDTIYAVQDMADDAVVGIRSSARTLGHGHIKRFITVCYGLMLALLMATGWLAGTGIAFFIGCALAAAHMAYQIRALPCTAEQAGALFRSNQWLGLALLFALLVDRLL